MGSLINIDSKIVHSQNTEKKGKLPKVLIVEDDRSLEPIWSYVLERVSRKSIITWAIEEAEAEDLIIQAYNSGNQFDIVITDIYLSGAKTGIDLWNHFYNLLQGKIIVTSSLEYLKFLQSLNENSAQPLFIQKPLRVHECIEAVYGVLQRSSKL